MENHDLDTTSRILSTVPAADGDWTVVGDGGSGGGGGYGVRGLLFSGLLFSIGFRDQWYTRSTLNGLGEWRNRKFVHLYYGEYDDININNKYSYDTFVARIKHPSFEHQFNNHDLIVGSCNGLVCVSKPNFLVNDPVYICNPFTKEYVDLPKSIYQVKGFMVNGFGYHHSTDEYKVVRIYYPDQLSRGQVEVYTLGSGDGWRKRGEVPYSLSPTSGVLVNGVLHWLDYKDWKIVAFDLADEEFLILPSPPCLLPLSPPCYSCFDLLRKPTPTTLYQLLVLGGCLCVVHQERGERVDIWSLKRDHSAWSWSKEFSIARDCLDEDRDHEPFALTKRNEVLMWYNGTILSCYDPKTETFKKLMDDDMDIEYFQAIPHMISSVSLKALGEESKFLGDDYQII